MREPYSEGVASHAGPESCADGRKAGREALTGVCVGRVLSREINYHWGADAFFACGRQHPERRQGETPRDPARSKTSGMRRTTSRENREAPRSPAPDGGAGRAGKSKDTIQR
jgi:RNA-directed DNA polymerase